MNRLYFGDNLKWLSDRKEFPDESVDLVYLDPPFNSNADYNVLFREPSGQVSQAQFHAFTDTWSWADAVLADRLRKLNPYYANERKYVESLIAYDLWTEKDHLLTGPAFQSRADRAHCGKRGSWIFSRSGPLRFDQGRE